MDLLRHWVVFPKRPGDPHRFITLADAVEEWARLGYRVEGPFVSEASATREAVEPSWLTSNEAFEIAHRGAKSVSFGKLSPAQLTAALNALSDHLRGR
jgi:hypothetical protein